MDFISSRPISGTPEEGEIFDTLSENLEEIIVDAFNQLAPTPQRRLHCGANGLVVLIELQGVRARNRK
jgi:hypothetical protein